MTNPPKVRIACLAALLVTAPAWAATADEDAAMAATQAACEAFRVGDLAALERLLTPDFTLISSSAVVQTRQSNLDEVRRGDTRYQVFRNHSMAARVFGDAAVVVGITSIKGESGGSAFAADLRFTDTLVRQQGQWRLVASHATPIPIPK